MSDLFHEGIPEEFIGRVFDVIDKTPQHTYQILTKRPERMAQYFYSRTVPDNAWLGVSVEDRKYGLPRIDYLRAIRCRIRFLSIEPLLEDLGEFDLSGIRWVIVGGESGPKARKMSPEWVSAIERKAKQFGCDFFFKQWGAYGPDGMLRNKKANGRIFDGKIWNETPINCQV